MDCLPPLTPNRVSMKLISLTVTDLMSLLGELTVNLRWRRTPDSKASSSEIYIPK